ncbi:MAG: GNAT family N-acetyltransferase [Ginsengibacter sp.]
MPGKILIKTAQTKEDYLLAKKLILEYVAWLGIDLSFQNFDAEMEALPGMYNEQNGGLFLAFKNDEAVGVAGLRRFSITESEVKRMFVKEEARGFGIGKLLLQKCIETARKTGYKKIKLDTADFMQTAIKLYIDNGFVEISAYRYNPHEAARYFELDLDRFPIQ